MADARGAWLLFLVSCAFLARAVGVTSVLSLDDQVRFKQKFYDAMPFKDLETAAYSVISLKLMKAEVPPTQDVCKFAKDNVDNSDVKSIFHASVIAEFVGSCKLVVDDAVKTILSEAVNEGTDMVTLYYAVVAQSFLGIKVSSDEVIKAIKAAINTDEDSILGAAYAMLIGERLAKGADVSFIAEMIEDTVAQADEIDNQYLQFEGGLHPTSLVVYATYTFSEYSGKAPAITEEQVIKFANYLLTRKHVQSVKETATLFLALDKLGNNPFHVPVVVQLYGAPVVSDDQKLVKVRVTNVLDKPFGKMTVTATSAEDSEGTTVLSNKVLTAGADDDFIVIESDLGRGMFAAHSYELNFMTSKPGPGVYSISFSVKPHKEDKRLIGTSSGQVKVKVVTKVSVEDVELSVLDKEQNIKSKTMSVKYPTAISTVIDADYHQKVVMKFSLKSESSGDLFTPHQAFVRLTNEKTKQEIFFVTEPEPSKVFKFDLDVGATAKDSFGSLSGKYKMELIVGDAVIQNPFEWNIGVLSLTFAQEAAKPSKDKESMYSSRPEIEHMFRVPEKRPPKAVSTAFTVLIFVPLVIMLVVWMKLGANISNFPFSLGGIIFHLGLGAILALYVGFFISLNMFSTLKILALIGGLTFLGGNSLLSSIAARRGKRPTM
ncbi:dolichyl-diphosphooligosaccharide--protein glycosyltransferase subunit 2-like isoform X1 [Acropora muricata]|uniref:dolichyl-diphosphooligosaccharide--protein glycosyltransferase subunit 2-like isoform X1 n=1 Tax=Acropora millepora TaxID=45264 RepID=UPI001CF346AB|nr:dolichyl-diphosphooligosaccharide--protein glycosyltransferase subunit 2-like isoform X1 [Acropora millepora]